MSRRKQQAHPLRLYRRRHVPPLSQGELAQMLGVSRVAVTRWESRARQPDHRLCSIIVRMTGIPLVKLRPDLAKLVSELAA